MKKRRRLIEEITDANPIASQPFLCESKLELRTLELKKHQPSSGARDFSGESD